MVSDPDDFEPARPVCGILSTAAPFLGFALAIIIECYHKQHRHGSTGIEVLACLVDVMPIAFLVGTVLAIVALRRHERFRALPVIGLVLNLPPLLWCLYGLVLTIMGK